MPAASSAFAGWPSTPTRTRVPCTCAKPTGRSPSAGPGWATPTWTRPSCSAPPPRPAPRPSIPATACSARTPRSRGRWPRPTWSGWAHRPRRSSRWATSSPPGGRCWPPASSRFQGPPSRSATPPRWSRSRRRTAGRWRSRPPPAGAAAASASSVAPTRPPTPWPPPPARRPRPSATAPATWSGSSSGRAMSRSRSSPTPWAAAVAKACGYVGAGTVEFLWDPASGGAWFLEMNTRIQVEHPITEQVTGIDIVAAQLRVAAGEPLGLAQEDVRVAGHAVECRVNAEDPGRGFLPTPGAITALRWPGGPGIRVDAGYQAGDAVSPFYDDLLGKVIAWGRNRDQAIGRMLAALADLEVGGVASTAPALLQVLDHHDFRAGAHWTTWLEEAADLGGMPASAGMPAAPASEPDFTVTVDGRRWPVRLHRQRPSSLGRRPDAGASAVVSPLAGTLTRVEVATGQRVEEGALLAVVEAMKMETPVDRKSVV